MRVSQVFTKAKESIISHYTTPDLGFATSWPNSKTNIPDTGVYIDAHFLGLGLTRIAHKRYLVRGVLQLDVSDKIGVGNKTIKDTVTDIHERFKVGKIWTHENKDYRVRNIASTRVIPVEDRVVCFVSVYWNVVV